MGTSKHRAIPYPSEHRYIEAVALSRGEVTVSHTKVCTKCSKKFRIETTIKTTDKIVKGELVATFPTKSAVDALLICEFLDKHVATCGSNK